MLTATARQLAPLEVGSNVAIPIPDVDKGRAELMCWVWLNQSRVKACMKLGQLLEA